MEYDVTSSEIEECESLIESHWRAVVGAYTVRLALAPLVEAYILIDRVLYLWEHGMYLCNQKFLIRNSCILEVFGSSSERAYFLFVTLNVVT